MRVRVISIVTVIIIVIMSITTLILCNDEPVDKPMSKPTTVTTHTTTTTTTTVTTTTTKPAPIFELSEYERSVVECIVMGEASGESYKGQVLVAQCILNACLKDGLKPSEVRHEYQYSGWNNSPSESVIRAVRAVFDDGYKVTSEPILYFYAPKYCNGSWHETQEYVLTEGGHKFFKLKDRS